MIPRAVGSPLLVRKQVFDHRPPALGKLCKVSSFLDQHKPLRQKCRNHMMSPWSQRKHLFPNRHRLVRRGRQGNVCERPRDLMAEPPFRLDVLPLLINASPQAPSLMRPEGAEQFGLFVQVGKAAPLSKKPSE